MAAPVVAGAAILLRQALDSAGATSQANQNGILGLMKNTAVTLNDGDDENDNVVNSGLNFKRLNLSAALDSIQTTNRAPTLAAIADQTMPASRDSITVPLVADDADGDALTYAARVVSVDGNPAPGAELIIVNVQLTVNPPVGYVGTFGVEVTVSDGNASASRTFKVTVTTAANSAPVLAPIADQTMSQTKTVPLSASDADGDPLSFSARTVSGSSELYQLDQQLGLDYGGSYFTNNLRLGEKWIASSTSQWYIILPSGELRRWLGTIDSTLSDAALVARLSAEVHADPSLLWNASAPPSVAYSFANGALTMQLQSAYTGSFVVEVTVSDGQLSASRTFTVTIGAETNVAPVIDPIADQTMTFGQGLTLTVPARDANGDVLTFSGRVTQQGANQLYTLKQQYGFRDSGLNYANLLRLNEKWILGSSSRWYILLPNGELRRWLGTLSKTLAANALLATLPTQVHANPSVLWNAVAAPVISLAFSGAQLSVQAPGFLGSFSVEVTASDGSLTASRSFAVRIAAGNAAKLATPLNAADARVLQKLDKKLGLLSQDDSLTNSLGLGEKWLLGKKNRWYILLPNGEVRRWLGTVEKTFSKKPLAAPVVAAYDDPGLLWNAATVIKMPKM
jgi:hypothetical protein